MTAELCVLKAVAVIITEETLLLFQHPNAESKWLQPYEQSLVHKSAHLLRAPQSQTANLNVYLF